MPKIIPDLKLAYKDVLIKPRNSSLKSRKDVQLSRRFKFLHSGREWEGIPIIVANLFATGTLKVAQEVFKFGLLTCLHKLVPLKEITKASTKKFFANVIPASGITKKDLDRLDKIIKEAHPNFICLDIANGYLNIFLRTIAKLRKKYPHTTLIAGNVADAQRTKELIRAGADIVKIGIGPGSVCTTRKKTGVGYPQLSAVIESAKVAHTLKAHIIADGGCTTPGDVAKAFCAGADFVMIGGMFAGHKETDDQLIEENGEKYKIVYGSSSKPAMRKLNKKTDIYRTDEGKVVKIPYKGPIKNTVSDILAGLRSTGTYIGAKKLSEFESRAVFIRTTIQTNDIFQSELHL